MNRILFPAATLLGGAAVIWMAVGFLGSSALAFTVTAVIGILFGVGIAELLQFRHATQSLDQALGHSPQASGLDNWIGRLHPSLQNGVRLRIVSEPVALPGPVFTPYLVGLLVMLGLLGTFLGMVDTLRGAVIALEGSTELETIRAGMAEPIRGLGVAFGTSVAGVAASAMLGLNSTLARRERLLATRALDGRIATDFREFTLAHSRDEAFQAMRNQAEVLPEVVNRLDSLAEKLEKMGDNVGRQVISNQENFNASAEALFEGLASSVDNSLRQTLEQGGQLANERITGAVEDTMQAIRENADATARQLEKSLDELREKEAQRTQGSIDQERQILAERQETLEQLGSLSRSLEQSSAGQQQAIEQMLNASAETLQNMANTSAEALKCVAEEFQQALASRADELTEISANAVASGAEIASMGEAFTLAVDIFKESSQELIQGLASIEQSLENSSSRSDEQLGYYLSQAREIIDQSLISQREVIEEMRQLAPGNTEVAAEAS